MNDSHLERKTKRIFTSKLPVDHIVTSRGPGGMDGPVSHSLPMYLCRAPPIILPKSLSLTVGSLFKGHFSVSKNLQGHKFTLGSKTINMIDEISAECEALGNCPSVQSEWGKDINSKEQNGTST